MFSEMGKASIHPSTSKFDDQLILEEQTVAASPKPQHRNPSLHGFKNDRIEDGKRPPNFVETSKLSHDKNIDKGCQPLKEVEIVEGLQSPNPPKEDIKE